MNTSDKTQNPEKDPDITGGRYNPYSKGDEINLMELVLILVKNWRMGLIVFLTVLAGAAIYLVVARPVYESHADVRVGKVGFGGSGDTPLYLEEPEVAAKRLSEKYRVNDRFYTVLPRVNSVKVINKDIIEISTIALTPEEARKKANDAVSDILQHQDVIYTENMEKYKQVKEQLTENINMTRKTLAETERRIGGMEDVNPVLAGVLIDNKNSLLGRISDMQDRLQNLEFFSKPPRTFETSVIKQATLSEHPSQPRYMLFIALSMILGIFLSVIVIFLVEFSCNVKRLLREGN